MIEIRGLYKTYGGGDTKVEALKNINLNIPAGEIFGVIGLSGAGKSSLVRCMNLLERPERGEVIIDGRDLTKVDKAHLRDARKKIGMVFQHFNLLMNRTVFDNIAFPLVVADSQKPFIEKRVTELLELVGLTEKRNAYPAMLSGGQKQRVGIARALAAEPSVIVCDEATSALDPTTTKSILSLLKRINAELGVTIVMITHEMEVIREICGSVAVMEDGGIIEQGRVAELLIHPKTDTTRKFFKSVDTELDNEVYKRAIQGAGRVIKAVFPGERSTDPYICNMIKNYGVEAAILLGNIQHVENALIGTLVIKINGSPPDMDNAIKYLADSGVIVEVLHDAF